MKEVMKSILLAGGAQKVFMDVLPFFLTFSNFLGAIVFSAYIIMNVYAVVFFSRYIYAIGHQPLDYLRDLFSPLFYRLQQELSAFHRSSVRAVLRGRMVHAHAGS